MKEAEQKVFIGASQFHGQQCAVPIFCPWCESGRVFTVPPYDYRMPAVWLCAECRGKFSVVWERMETDGPARR